MGDVLTFTPRPRLPEPAELPRSTVRATLEDAVQAALDTADHLIAVLDGMDGDGDDEDGGDAEPSLGAPEGHESQVVWLRGADDDREAEAPPIKIPDVQIVVGIPLPWSGRGNVLTALGGAVLNLTGAS